MKDKIIKKSHNFLDLLKYITKWITNDIPYENLEKLMKIFNVSPTIILSRICSYGYSNPHVIWYINKYFNSLYDYSKISNKEIFESFRFILKNSNHNKTKLYFIKSNLNKDNNRVILNKTFKEYFKDIHNIKLNSTELQCLYNLFENGKIKEDDIKKINNILNRDDDSKQLQLTKNNTSDNIKQIIIDEFNENRIKKLPDNITQFVNELKTNKLNRELCKQCKLNNNKMVVLDTNAKDFGPVDIMFISTNPSKDDVIFDKPFTNKSGQYLREHMYYMKKNTTWVLTNIFLCNTVVQNELGKKDDDVIKEATKCWENVEEILKKFPAKYYVLVGSHAMKLFGINGSIIKLSGEVITNNNINFIVMPNPSSVIMYHGDKEDAYKASFNLIYKLLSIEETTLITSVTEKKEIIMNKEQTLSTIDLNTHTLFDVVNLDNKNILFVFIEDITGIKKYITKEYQFPVFIKHENWNKCELIESNFTYKININGFDKMKLMNTLKNIQELDKKNCTIGDINVNNN